MRGVPGQRAARADRDARRGKAAVNLMMHEATVHYDPAGDRLRRKLVAAINDTGYVVAPAGTASTGSADDESASRRRRASTRTLLHKSLVSLALGAVAMVASMPLMGGGTARAASRAIR